LKSSLPHILAFCLLPGLGVAQGVPTNDSGLTARDIIETGDREADLAVQADKLAVRELIAEIEREQLETLQRILDAQTSFGGQGLPAMVLGLESGSGDPDRAVEAVYGTGEIDPNPGDEFFQGVGCPSCNGTGYRGRVALYEVMPVSDKIRDATIANLAVDEIKRLAIAGGMTTLRMAGNRKILEGRTSIEEVVSNTVSDDIVVSEPIREVQRRVEG